MRNKSIIEKPVAGGLPIVTSVTGSLPISSTGGTTPNITIRDATNTQNGAVTAAQIQALESATSAQHAKQHALDATADHTIGSLTNTYLVKSDGSKLVPATNTDSQVSSAVSASHAAVTVSAPIVLSGQALEIKNNAVSPAQITAVDIGTIANSDTVIPTSKAVYTAINNLELKLTTVAIQTSNYTAHANELIPCDVSGGSFTVQLPSAPANDTAVQVVLAQVGTTGILEILCGGTDAFTTLGGSQASYMSIFQESRVLRYRNGVWYSISAANPSNFAVNFPGIDAATPITNANITIDPVARTLTVIPPLGYFNVLIDGDGKSTRFRKTGNVVFGDGSGTSGNNTWNDTSGMWYFYFNSSAQPVTTQTSWTVANFPTAVPLYRILWNSTLYDFTITSGNVIEGDTYTNNGQTFTIRQTYTGVTSIKTYGTGAPSASGTLTWATGSGSGNLTFSAFSVTPKKVAEYVEYHLNDISADEHVWMHLYGCVWADGFTIVNNAKTSGTPNSNGTETVIALTTGTAIDDNLEYTITNCTPNTATASWTQDLGHITPATLTSSNSALFTVFRQNTAGNITFRDETRFPFDWSTITNLPNYITATGVRTPVSNGYFFVNFVYATQNPNPGKAIKIVSATSEFTTITNARAYNWVDIQTNYPFLNDGEVRPLYRLIHEYRTVYDVGAKKSVLREVQDLRKAAITSTATASGSLPASSVTNIPYSTTGSTNVQAAIDELTDEKTSITRTITATAPLTIAGTTSADLSADRTIAITPSNTTTAGSIVQATAPASGLRNILAIDNAETARSDKALFDTTHPSALGTAAEGTAMTAARIDHVHSSTLTSDINFATYKAIAMACDNGATLPSTPVIGQWFLHTPTGRKVLMQYSGSAWIPIISIGTMTMYVAGNSVGTDSQNNGTGTSMTSGSLVSGRSYHISTFVAGDDFSNVGGYNRTGNQFKATNTTPTDWTHGSTLVDMDSTAFLTVQYAIDSIPGLVTGSVSIRVSGDTFNETVTVRGKAFSGNYLITIIGTLLLKESFTTATLTQGTGKARSVINKTDVFTGDSYANMLAYFNTDNVYRVIDGHTVTLPVNQGGAITSTDDIAVGDVIKGVTSGAYGDVIGVTLNSGAWGSSTADATLLIQVTYGTFQNAENIDNITDTKSAVCVTSSTVTSDNSNITITGNLASTTSQTIVVYDWLTDILNITATGNQQGVSVTRCYVSGGCIVNNYSQLTLGESKIYKSSGSIIPLTYFAILSISVSLVTSSGANIGINNAGASMTISNCKFTVSNSGAYCYAIVNSANAYCFFNYNCSIIDGIGKYSSSAGVVNTLNATCLIQPVTYYPRIRNIVIGISAATGAQVQTGTNLVYSNVTTLTDATAASFGYIA